MNKVWFVCTADVAAVPFTRLSTGSTETQACTNAGAPANQDREVVEYASLLDVHMPCAV